MTANDDPHAVPGRLLGVDVVRPKVAETTALGAAYAAGIAVGFWDGERTSSPTGRRASAGHPHMDQAERDRTYRLWKKAVTRTFDWVDDDVK